MKTLLRTAVSSMALAAFSTTVAMAECTNERWNAVMERGTLVVGVKADYKPWAFAMRTAASWAWRLIWPLTWPALWVWS